MEVGDHLQQLIGGDLLAGSELRRVEDLGLVGFICLVEALLALGSCLGLLGPVALQLLETRTTGTHLILLDWVRTRRPHEPGGSWRRVL